MRLLTVQIDLDKATPVELEPALNQMLAMLRLRGIPLVDGVGHTLRGNTGQHVGYWSIQPNIDPSKKENER